MGSEGGGGARRGQIKNGILDAHFNYSTEPKWGSRCQLPAAGGGGGGRGLCSPASRCCISADLLFFCLVLNSEELSREVHSSPHPSRDLSEKGYVP